MPTNLRIGVLASHRGSALKAVVSSSGSRLPNCAVVVVISNNSTSGALQFAKESDIACAHLSSNTHADPMELDHAICTTLADQDVNLVLLLGYMKKLGPATLQRYSGRILNIHPALLPKFGGKGMYGMRVHEAVLQSGEVQSGATLHLVGEAYDEGPTIAQVVVSVAKDDTARQLAERIALFEHELLISTLRKIELDQIVLPICSQGPQSGRTG